MSSRGVARTFAGWGRTTSSISLSARARDEDELAELIRAAPARGVSSRGLGRSYGDAAQNGGGLVIEPFRPDAEPVLTGDVVTVSAGASLGSLLETVVPRGLLPPVLPGTRQVSVGGAIAADVHGKNHHVDGSLGRWVERIVLIDGLGERREVTPAGDPDTFWATVGGMGLTGVVTEATLRLLPIETSYLRVRARRVRDFDALLSAMRDSKPARYQVAWVDAFARGRSILEDGEPARRRELPDGVARHPLECQPRTRIVAPSLAMSPLRPRVVRAFNAAWWRRADDGERVVPLSRFFHPLDGVGEWHRLYGRRGFLQYQIAVPDGAEQVLERFVTTLPDAGLTPYLVVLKRFGPGDDGLLSFPRPGWTIAADFPSGDPALARALDEMDELTASVGGRVYLAKDSRLRPDVLTRMYPELPRWQKIRAELDPLGRFQSDLDRRLSMR
ncbi:MAG TPA: FAD-binding oxidoreductase [Acidothermaceae bacterium]|jgi:decaprenylphospho-beta-D-ribofuranose 2-oxidase